MHAIASLPRLAVLLSIVLAGTTALHAQVLLDESLTDRKIWSHDNNAAFSDGLTDACARFGKVDRLNMVTSLRYRRQAVTLQPGTYRASFRHRKLGPQNTARLYMRAAIGTSNQDAWTPARQITPNQWQWSNALTFVVTQPTSVNFQIGNHLDAGSKGPWLFDAFKLERRSHLGDGVGDSLGYSVSGAGDVNDDGYADTIFGTPYDNNNGTHSGSARVVSGKDGRVIYTLNGDSSGDSLGWSVSDAGDVNGDGFADLIAGAPYDDNKGASSGSARVFSGKDGKVLYTFNGDSAGDLFGWSVSGAGDVNCDGFADLIVGAPADDDKGRDAGSARIFSGKDGKILYTFFGNSLADEFGRSVSGAGDVNRDGFADVIVGAPYDGPLFAARQGSASVLSGKDGTTLHLLKGTNGGDIFGWSVSGAGDINGDGFADVIAGAPWEDNTHPQKSLTTGTARVVSGKDGKRLYLFQGDSAGSQFGYSVSSAGDFDGDGVTDMVVGANRVNRARVLSGATGRDLHTTTLAGGGGWSVSCAGDINGDGLADVVTGAPGNDDGGKDAGSARIVPGRSVTARAAATINGNSVADESGRAVAMAGDVNGDGFTDVIIGTPYDGPLFAARQGSAQVISGKDSKVLHTFTGGNGGDHFGWSVAGAGDVNNDGFADVIVGAPYDDTPRFSGSARVLSGKDGKTLYTFVGDGNGDQFGWAVDGAGDVNGDGHADLLVGARHDDNNGANSGSARILSGKDGKTLYTFNGIRAGHLFGSSVSAAGDVNNDGTPDVIVGAVSNGNSARVLSGKDGKILHTFKGQVGDQFGASVSGAGDINGDGFADLFVGAPKDDNLTRTDSGSAQVFSGKDGKVLHRFEGTGAKDELGSSVSTTGDVNDDGIPDLIVGIPGSDNRGANSGSARIFSGSDGHVIRILDGDSIGDAFGHAVSGGGDFNCDDLAGFVVGAPMDDNAGRDSGSARIFKSYRHRTPGKTEIYGVPCLDSAGRLPRMQVNRAPKIGRNLTYRLHYGAKSPVILAVGLGTRYDIQLGSCRAFVLPISYRFLTMSAPPLLTWTSSVPTNPGLIGLRLTLQWALEDPQTKFLLTSDALEVQVGSPLPK